MRVAFITLTTSELFGQSSPSKNIFINNLMPEPASLTIAPGALVLTPQFHAATTAFDSPRLDEAIRRTMQQMRHKTGLALSTTDGPAIGSQLSIAVKSEGEQVQSVNEDESYSLVVTPSSVTIKAPTVVGAMHGLETLIQLVQPSGSDYVLPSVSIQDSPRFVWRGLLIDCARHFEPMDVLRRTLDGMAAVKLNVLHLHLTDDQGFRVESKLYPKLTSVGSDGRFYTQEDLREIVHYAHARGIRVVPEFEMPGHSTAWQVAYPELASGNAPTSIRREFGVSPFALDPTKEETYQFIRRFLGEMATIFTDSYVHIGGDETPAPDWKRNPKILAFMRAHQLKDSEALQAYFNMRVLKILTHLNKHMVGWDEILNPALPRDIVIQSWRGQVSLIKGAREGFQGILSSPYYLDTMEPASKYYLVDPLPSNSPVTVEQRKLLLGGEVCQWGELVDERTIDSRIWPITAAIAERFWSSESVIDVGDMYRRLNVISVQLEHFGLQHLTREDASLREMAGTQHIDQLSTFASVLEPITFSERFERKKITQLTVLDSFVDAVHSDPPSRHEIDRLTRNFLKAPQTDVSDQESLKHWFESMAYSVPIVEQQMQWSPRLAEIHVRAAQLSDLAKTGLDAMQFISSRTRPPVGWKKNKMAQIEAAEPPIGFVRFTFLAPLTALINAVQE